MGKTTLACGTALWWSTSQCSSRNGVPLSRRAKVEVSFLRRCVDPNAPKEPLDADAQAEADGGDDEAPQDVESDDGSVAGSSPGGSSPHSSQASLGA